MKIAVIGIGHVGSALGTGWAKRGHQVTFGVRNPADPKVAAVLKQAGTNANAVSVAEAAAVSEVILFAAPWAATQAAIREAGDLTGKVVLDCSNPLKPDLSGLELGHTNSAGEQVARWAKGARVVKIFNTTGAGNMENAGYPGGAPAMFYCGDDAQAKTIAGALATELGFEAVDAGDLTVARVLEPLAMLWIQLAIKQGFGMNFAFKLSRR
jgi:8-hydroxy-5-deazaflavin:NADPH oxidoreductase